jgi:hypothetical protein
MSSPLKLDKLKIGVGCSGLVEREKLCPSSVQITGLMQLIGFRFLNLKKGFPFSAKPIVGRK